MEDLDFYCVEIDVKAGVVKEYTEESFKNRYEFLDTVTIENAKEYAASCDRLSFLLTKKEVIEAIEDYDQTLAIEKYDDEISYILYHWYEG